MFTLSFRNWLAEQAAKPKTPLNRMAVRRLKPPRAPTISDLVPKPPSPPATRLANPPTPGL